MLHFYVTPGMYVRQINNSLEMKHMLKAALRTCSRQHLSNDDCLQDEMEDYQNCSVLYFVLQLYTVTCTHI